MLRMFIPLPLTTSERVKIVKRRQQKTPSTIEGVNYTGDFVAVKDYEYVRVAKLIGETQVGVNLFYLVDKKIIIGYRTYVGYYLRQGVKSARPKQKMVQKKPSKTPKIGKASSIY